MGEKTQQHLKELLQSFDNAMLITQDDGRNHARPMAVAGVEGASTLWFVTGIGAPKSDEIREDSYVSVTFQSDSRYVALSGRAAVVRDRAKLDELWKESWKTWFPNGKDDPNVALIRVTVTDAEFWDNAGTKGIKYAFEAAKAYLTGTTPDPVEGVHGRVKTNGGIPESTRH